MCMQQPLNVTKDFQPYYMPNTPAYSYAGQRIKENPIYFVWYKNVFEKRKQQKMYEKRHPQPHTHTLTHIAHVQREHTSSRYFSSFLTLALAGYCIFSSLCLCDVHTLTSYTRTRCEEAKKKNRSTSFEFIVTRFNHISLYLAFSFTTIIAFSFASFLGEHARLCACVCVGVGVSAERRSASPYSCLWLLGSCETLNTKQIQMQEETIRKMYGNWVEKWHACEMADNE